MNYIRQKIIEEMEKKGWNTTELARRSGVPQPTVQRFIKGQHGQPRDTTIKKIAAGLGILEAELRGLSAAYLSDNETAERQPGYNVNLIQADEHHQQTKLKKTKWSEFCTNSDSITDNTELLFMLLKKEIEVTDRCFWIEINSTIYKDLKPGSMLLINPDATPNTRNTIIITFQGEPKTLAKYYKGLGGLHIEPLETGYPESVPLAGKQYTVDGVVIWVQPPGYAP